MTVTPMMSGAAAAPDAGADCQILICSNNCNSAQCQQMCLSASGAEGQALFNAVITCAQTNCLTAGVR